jgi:HTH-type transcriptional regulator/antitoxin HipB
MLIRSPKELALSVITQRKKLKLSQAKLADLVGLKQQTISEFEINPESTKVGTLFRILSSAKLDMKLLAKGESKLADEPWNEEW